MSEKHKTIGDLLRSLNIDEDFIEEFEGETYDQLLQWCVDLYQAGELMYDHLLAEDTYPEPSDAIEAWEEARKLKDIRDTKTTTREESV